MRWRRLGDCGDPRARRALLWALGHEWGEVRIEAAHGPAKLGDLAWQTWMQGYPGDYDGLAASGDPRALDLLELVLLHSGTPYRYCEGGAPAISAADAIVRFGGDCALTILLTAMWHRFDPGPGDLANYAVTCLRALGEFGERRAIPYLAALAEDADYYEFCHAAADCALPRLGDPRGVDRIAAALTHKDYSRRQWACAALADGGLSRDQPAVRALFDRPSEAVRVAVAEALASGKT